MQWLLFAILESLAPMLLSNVQIKLFSKAAKLIQCCSEVEDEHCPGLS